MRALHLIHSTGQLDEIERTDYTIVVCNPGFGSDATEQIRLKFPDAALLQTINAHSVPGFGQGNERLDELRADLWDCTVPTARGWDHASATDGNTRLLDFSMEAAEALAEWAAAGVNFDGVYLDELWGEPPRWFLARAEADVWTHRWPAYRDHLLRCLDATSNMVVVNSAGYIPTAITPDGICIEKAHMSKVLILAKFQAAAERGCTSNVAWGNDMDAPGLGMTGDLTH